MDIVFKAIKIAEQAHSGQTRKVSGSPYIVHPLAVSYLLAQYKGNSKQMPALLASAILHDTIEDTDITFSNIYDEFGPLVASLVYELTSDKDEISKVGKKKYLMVKMAGMSNYGLTIKLVDRLANMMDSPTEKMKQDTIEILDYVQEKRKLTNTQRDIIDSIRKTIGDVHEIHQ